MTKVISKKIIPIKDDGVIEIQKLHDHTYIHRRKIIKSFNSIGGFPNSYAREVALAIYDWEKEKLDFAVEFVRWKRALKIGYVSGSIRGKDERQDAFKILDMTDTEQVQTYINQLDNDGK